MIAFRDPNVSLHPRAVAAVRAHASDYVVLPASVYAEILVGPIRSGAAALRSVEQFLDDFAISTEPLSPAISRRAAELRAKTPICDYLTHWSLLRVTSFAHPRY